MSNSENNRDFIPPFGGYRSLYSYQKAEIIFDATAYFTKRFFSKFDRTASQMNAAARSGKQNIAEASMVSGTSKQTEILLTNVARGSLEELKLDYIDYLRKNKYRIWEKDDPLVTRIRDLNKSVKTPTYETFQKAIEHENPEIVANSIITLISICNYLLYKQVMALQEDFLENGGIRERMTKARNYRFK